MKRQSYKLPPHSFNRTEASFENLGKNKEKKIKKQKQIKKFYKASL